MQLYNTPNWNNVIILNAALLKKQKIDDKIRNPKPEYGFGSDILCPVSHYVL